MGEKYGSFLSDQCTSPKLSQAPNLALTGVQVDVHRDGWQIEQGLHVTTKPLQMCVSKAIEASGTRLAALLSSINDPAMALACRVSNGLGLQGHLPSSASNALVVKRQSLSSLNF